jgi:hypothetical protein
MPGDRRITMSKMNRFIPFRFQRITRRQGGGSAGVFSYVEEADADDAANKVSQRKRKGIAKKEKGGLVRASQ